jgi:hypothetical protein
MADFPYRVRAAARRHTDRIMSLSNVVGVGIALRRVGDVLTDEPVVVTYVTRKLPREALPAEQRVPVELDTDGEVVRTDVVEIAEPRYVEVDTATYRPVRGGCQIGAAGGGAGTAGAVMYDRRDQQVVLLTCNHVLTTLSNPTVLPANTSVQQPAGGTKIGRSKRIVPMFPAPLGAADYRFFATVDAGIVALDSDIAGQFDVVEIGPHPFVVLPPYIGLDVVRRGFRTQLRTGTVEAVGLTVTVKAPNGDRHRIGGDGSVFSIRSPERLISAMPGDSGSLVVDAAGGAARGLVFASDNQSGGLTWACELGPIMSLLELDTPCTGGLNALIRRSVFRRLADRWALSQELAAAGGLRNALVSEQIETVARFRRRYLPNTPDGSLGGAIGEALQRLAHHLAHIIHHDEVAAGLFDRAFGEWLIQPTVFDMLEYRFPDQFAACAAAAFRRVRELRPDAEGLEALERLFGRAAGRSMRELLAETPGAGCNECSAA